MEVSLPIGFLTTEGDLAYNIVFNIKMRDIKFFFYLWSFSNLFLIKKQKTFKFVKSACTLCDVSFFFFLAPAQISHGVKHGQAQSC